LAIINPIGPYPQPTSAIVLLGPGGFAFKNDWISKSLDVNRRALELAKKNKKKNHIENADIFESDGMTQVPALIGGFVNTKSNWLSST
jgi:hypothetical protein